MKHVLSQNKLTVGSWVTIGHPAVVEILSTAGFDWLTIDMEHAAIDLETAYSLIITTQAKGMKSLVRVSKNEEVIIKRVLDMGADGIIVPMVCSKEDAEQAVAYAKYPPTGRRGVGLYRAQAYGTGFDAYKEWVKNESVVIAQIEHINAVRSIEEILSTEGIDGIMIGPYDLSGSMGFPGEYHREDVKEAIRTVEQACKKLNKPLGFHVIHPDHALMQEKIDAGYSFLAFSIDFFFMGNKAREEMSLLWKARQENV